jgi:hypothetical protein
MKITELAYHKTFLGELTLRRRMERFCKTERFTKLNSEKSF